MVGQAGPHDVITHPIPIYVYLLAAHHDTMDTAAMVAI
jgi:hypothetical protein